MKDYSLLQQNYMAPGYVNRGLSFTSGEGVYLFTSTGEQYLDLMSNYGVNIFGHSHPKINGALYSQLQRLSVLHGSFANDTRAEASRMLVQRCGEGYAKVYWSNSGSEAIEAALKFAVLATGKKKFIVCKGGYHGKTLGALTVTDGAKYRAPFEPLLWQTRAVDYNAADQLAEAIDSETAAFLVEPLQGEGGVIVPNDGYLPEAREICSKRSLLLILDEVQTGCGRTGTFLAGHRENVIADITCLGKGLAGGLPVGATVVSAEIAAKIPKHMHTSTLGGNPLTCAGAIATLQLLTEDVLRQVREMGSLFLSEIKGRGRGLMLGIQAAANRDWILKQLQAEKMIAIPAGEDIVRFLPPYIIQKPQLMQLKAALSKLAAIRMEI